MNIILKISAIFFLIVAVGMRNISQYHSALDGDVYHGTGKVSFFSVAPIENIDAHSQSMKSELNTSTNEVAFLVPIRSFKFKNGKMQTDFNENFMESDKYPDATYKGKIQEGVNWKQPGTYHAISKGTLTIHGVPKERIDTATVLISNDKIIIEGNFLVRVADHEIKIPTLVIKKIAEVVTVKFEEDYSTTGEVTRENK